MKSKWFSLLGVVLGLTLPVSAEYAEIVIDGNFSDWGSIPSITNDPLDHVEGGVDFKEMWVANDEKYLYIRYTLHVPADPFAWNVRTFIDGDNNPETGYHPAGQSSFGSEILIENESAYQQAVGSFNIGGITNASIRRGPSSGVVTQLEFRISRGITDVNTGERLMSGNTIRILLQDDRSPAGYDNMPDMLGVEYTFASPPPLPSYYKKITIDGGFPDWEGVPSVALSPTDNLGGVDFKEMWIANDEEYLYVKYTLHDAANPHNGYTMFFVDGDNLTTSGYLFGGVFGTEFMVNGDGNVYQQAGGGWNEGVLTDAELLHLPKSTATEFEFRVARTPTGVAGSFTGQPLLTSDIIRVVAYNETTSGSQTMPGKRGVSYLFAPKPPPQGTIMFVQ